jgi:hypothetical protein
MSAEAAAKLRELWGQLQFFTVDRTIAREPEDVSYINIYKPTDSKWPNGEPVFNDTEPPNEYKRFSQVPKKDRWRARVIWRYFYGFTVEGIRFDSDHHNTLNWFFGSKGLLDFNPGYVAHGIYDRPAAGQLICGIVEDTEKGQRLAKWFVCDEAFRLLVTAVREGTEHTEEELGRLLITDGFPDRYWALARLVLFDNVQAFVDCLVTRGAGRPTGRFRVPGYLDIYSIEVSPIAHPAWAMPHGLYQLRVDWTGMFLGTGYDQFVHELSYTLGEPHWWEQLLQIAPFYKTEHLRRRSDRCYACQIEKLQRSS